MSAYECHLLLATCLVENDIWRQYDGENGRIQFWTGKKCQKLVLIYRGKMEERYRREISHQDKVSRFFTNKQNILIRYFAVERINQLIVSITTEADEHTFQTCMQYFGHVVSRGIYIALINYRGRWVSAAAANGRFGPLRMPPRWCRRRGWAVSPVGAVGRALHAH